MLIWKNNSGKALLSGSTVEIHVNNAPTAEDFMIGGGTMARVPLDCDADCAADCHAACTVSCVEYLQITTQHTATQAVGTS